MNPVIGRAAIPKAGVDVNVWPPVFNIHDSDYSPDVKHLLDSQGGLMLFRHPSEKNYVLWNPNTKQFLLVPCPGYSGIKVVLAVEIQQWKPDRDMDLFKIVSFPRGRVFLSETLDIYHSRNSTWFEHKVKHINNPNSSLVGYKTYLKFHVPIDKCLYYLDRISVYLQGKLFILSYPHNLSCFTIGDSNVDDVEFHFIDLPDRVDTKTWRLGRIGSCGGRLQYAQIDQALSLVQIWVVSVDTRIWTEMYRVTLLELTTHPELVHLREVLFPGMRRKLKLLALHPESDDGVLRDADGVISIMFSGPLPPLGSEFAELGAILKALELFRAANLVGRVPLIVESDAKVILNWLSEPLQRPWRWWKIFRDIDALVTQIGNIQFQHICREKNVLADYLAKAGLQRIQFFEAWW
ncbi:hypothetical protein GQ457_12G021530 [Hibiscus cannabinus]